ncbi:hypothetical protein M744_02600 [Synechococcus elongatus UTEX 2973]|nr:hypothetical protein M744_02600 [Synechococcus elongatus UTEX 2973]
MIKAQIKSDRYFNTAYFWPLSQQQFNPKKLQKQGLSNLMVDCSPYQLLLNNYPTAITDRALD